jgi:hypothetical protein
VTVSFGVQVLPTGRNSTVWPFLVLLGALVTPGIVACAVHIWTQLSSFNSVSWMLFKSVAIVVWWAPNSYVVAHPFFMVQYTLSCAFGMCCPQRAAQSHAGGVCDECSSVRDPVKYVALLSAVMAVTEDLVFLGLTSVLYLANEFISTGLILSTPAYCVGMLLSCMHVLMEAWEHFPGIHQDFGGCLAGVCSLPQ